MSAFTKNSLKTKAKLTYFLFTLPAVILYSIFMVYPVISGFFYSMTDWNGFNQNLHFIGIDNFSKLIRDDDLFNSVRFTGLYTLLLVISLNGLALFLAAIVNHIMASRMRTFYRSIIFFPAVLSLITVGLIWNEIFYRAIPLIGKALGIGFLSSNLLSGPGTAVLGVLIVNLWQGISIPFVMIIAGMQSIPSDIYEAATIDGANGFQKFFRITLRFLIPVLNVTCVLSVKGGLTIFDYIKALTSGGPAGATESIGLFIYDTGITGMKYGYSIAVSVSLLLVICAISLMQIKFTSKYEVGQL